MWAFKHHILKVALKGCRMRNLENNRCNTDMDIEFTDDACIIQMNLTV